MEVVLHAPIIGSKGVWLETVGGRSQNGGRSIRRCTRDYTCYSSRKPGSDPLDTLIALRQAHTSGGDESHFIGVNVYDGGVINMLTDGVIELMKVISQAIQSATETAAMVLRIDNIITSKKLWR